MPFELKFAMPLRLRSDLATATEFWEQNKYRSWRNRFEGKTVFLIGWCDTAFTVVERLGDYNTESLGMQPWDLFEPAV